MIVTIDGPAGAGKSSIAKEVAQRIGFELLDTGAMYRAVTLGVLRAKLDLNDVDRLVRYAAAADLQWTDHRMLLDGEDVSDEIRTPDVTAAIRYLADPPAIRERLSEQQRRIAAGRNIVTEGRDQGAEVFPHAQCKLFLTASPEERARRRQQQLAAAGRHVTLEEILTTQNQRDLEDRMRPVGRLRAAPDAVVISTDGLTQGEVLEKVLAVVRAAATTAGVALREPAATTPKRPSSAQL